MSQATIAETKLASSNIFKQVREDSIWIHGLALTCPEGSLWNVGSMMILLVPHLSKGSMSGLKR
jgi:hypothetical protein